MQKLTNITDDARIIAENMQDYALSFVAPHLKLGVTGLARAGKTVFITSLVHNLLHGGRLSMFKAAAEGRLMGAKLSHQPDDIIPRFAYEDHLSKLVEDKVWPQSTDQLSELRLKIYYQSASFVGQMLKPGHLTLDLIDYPGEWLLDLPLLRMSYEEWCIQTFELSRNASRADLAKNWHHQVQSINPDHPFDEITAKELHQGFCSYLSACRHDSHALSTLPPGRFLMPGELANTPAITFAPLPPESKPQNADSDNLWNIMERRFESYKSLVIKPFFIQHFARLDRQVVLVDMLQAANAGASALKDLELALNHILNCFKTGQTSFFSRPFKKKIDKILFCATKADHLHHTQHLALENLLSYLTKRSLNRTAFTNAEVAVMAMSSLRATREANVVYRGETLPSIIGIPRAGETIDGRKFDGHEEATVFPGVLPDISTLLADEADDISPINFVRFRPPAIRMGPEQIQLFLPHIRLDKCFQFLMGDHLQ